MGTVTEMLRRAAELTGATMNQFLVQSALKEAQAVIEREEMIRLSARDWGWLLERLEAPPLANTHLQGAIVRYQKAQPDHADSSLSLCPIRPLRSDPGDFPPCSRFSTA